MDSWTDSESGDEEGELTVTAEEGTVEDSDDSGDSGDAGTDADVEDECDDSDDADAHGNAQGGKVGESEGESEGGSYHSSTPADGADTTAVGESEFEWESEYDSERSSSVPSTEPSPAQDLSPDSWYAAHDGDPEFHASGDFVTDGVHAHFADGHTTEGYIQPEDAGSPVNHRKMYPKWYPGQRIPSGLQEPPSSDSE